MANGLRGFRAAAPLALFLCLILWILAAACSIDSRMVTVDAAEQQAPIKICEGIPVMRDLITDFSDAHAALDNDGNPGIRFGMGPVPGGGVSYVFAAPGLAAPRLSLEPRGTDLALRIEAAPTMVLPDNYYLGVGLGFGGAEEVCLDASGYRGVTFTIDGSTGTCQLMFQVEIPEDYRVAPSSQVAACTLGELCYPPFSQPLVLDGPTTFAIPFTDLANGNPVGNVDVKTITEVSWKLFAPLTGTPCQASFVVDEVAFFR